MECEVNITEKKDRSSSVLASVLKEHIRIATDKLLLTDFSACVSLCDHVVAAVKSREESDGCDARLISLKETATVLAIQALAEQGVWQEVIPYVEKVYGHVRQCPGQIIQMCILLHAHVQEYMVCHSLVNNWLENNRLGGQQDAGRIVKIYVQQVLVPLAAFNLIPQVVDSCPSLTAEDKQMLLSPCPPTPERNDHSVDRPAQSLDSPAVPPTDTAPVTEDKKDRGTDIFPMYVNFVRRLWRNAVRKGWCHKVCRVTKVLLLFSFAVLALVQLQTDSVSHFSRAMEVWRMTVRVWHSMWKK